jgi:tellurite resistance protein TerC
VIYLFGAFLIFTSVKLALQKEGDTHPEDNALVRLVRRVVPVSRGYVGEHFLTRHSGALQATPLLLVLVAVESTDLVFATDSIPAVLGVTRDPFLVYTSNVFAILGLRSLYFVLSGAMERFHYLKLALSFILGFVGVKMLIQDWYEIPIALSLLIIAGLLVLAIVASWLRARRIAPRGLPAEHLPPP